ncbi:glycoside hydrolase family 16 protein [Pseudoduganella sp. HUAS MS19]
MRVEDGNLVTEARREAYRGKHYTSARLKTAGLMERRYGRFEARIRVPHGQGIWPAFWMQGADIGKAGWPRSGEIDIMENIGKEPDIVYGTVHGKWPFDRPFFVLLNLAVGVHRPAYSDATTTFPQVMLVDYVRVYRRGD